MLQHNCSRDHRDGSNREGTKVAKQSKRVPGSCRLGWRVVVFASEGVTMAKQSDQPKRHPRTGLLTAGPMTSIEEVIEHLAYRIGLIYHHGASFYGGDARGVDLVLQDYHEVWAEIAGRFDEFRDVWWKVGEEDSCGANNFSGCYLAKHPDADNEEVTEYVVRQWRKVSDRLGVPIRHAEIQRELESSWQETQRMLEELSQTKHE